jgi:hypothetical protein
MNGIFIFAEHTNVIAIRQNTPSYFPRLAHHFRQSLFRPRQNEKNPKQES